MTRNRKFLKFVSLAFLIVILPGAIGAAQSEIKFEVAPLSAAQTKSDWPSPVMDNETFGLLLFDLLEYKSVGSQSTLNWDIESWRGGDINRIWIKSEGSSGVGCRISAICARRFPDLVPLVNA